MKIKTYEEGFKDAMKACGNCKECYGKGYNTQQQGEKSGYTDFDVMKKVTLRGPALVMNFCNCSRGKQLKKLLTIKN